MKIFKIVLVIVLFSNCATIMHGTHQEVGFSSYPSDARITINGKEIGNTPLIEELKRKDQYIIKIELDGYQPYETTVTRKVSGWVWGNILLGGFLGLAVDAISGGLYKLSPEQIHVELSRSDLDLNSGKDSIIIFTTLKPKDEWEKIDNLRSK